MNEERYITGFNSGYTLAVHEPALLQTVTQNLQPANEYIEGLLDGKEQLENEKTNEQVQSINELRSRSLDKDRGLEM